ncbi:MAG: polymerase sigma-70 factor, subfamily [Gaiellales bacterium]|nr:polymerase sigma-70 factor, subfamily [Gaiellales bacterium]
MGVAESARFPRTLGSMKPVRTPPVAPSTDGREATLVQAARAGDERAFAELVSRHGRMVLSVAYAQTLSEPEAEDLAQETFLAAWRGLPRFRGECAFSTWLHRLARNTATDRHRRAFARPPAAGRHDLADVAAPARDDHRTQAHAVLAAARELPPEQREAVLLRELQGLSYEEIAEIQEVPLGTVRSRIANGRRAIAAAVGQVAG